MKRFALVTGASGAIGKAISIKLASEGYSLYLHYNQNEKGIGELLSEIGSFGGEYIPIKANLASKTGYLELANQIFSIDAIVHNAGNALYGLLEDLEEEETEALIQIHVTTPLLLTKKLLPKLRQKQNGNIVIVSSIWGQTGASYEVAYSTVKGAQLAFAKALSKELAPSKIRVNAVAPGAIQTPMVDGFTLEELEAIAAEVPSGRLGTPEEVANGVEFLLSEKSSYITGQVVAINGGWLT
ncbi:SDR family oxidoreductase [Mesobacillus sp. AQ2]|jgi:3-oxoacyl-[acyl-carrier protein] reductase|uniref:elongation factor P 5-aminopentanone reductase n=1 Tax=unclassified Mesobacillus TaxID=2675270 RepID=UPI00203C4E46|nr:MULTISPECIES: SDR family oxidoreductase [unclassified Mesobacillus]MCM3123242.1 SDR family oxidoreductase [Mesobacillus sp. MER 33]MCM3233275.1 SDR family oxidoreductase [Mesobacillus sp. MER 48]WHX42338.1 SDR family oxidoreductase [Mesobacillus sp. AQ2]